MSSVSTKTLHKLGAKCLAGLVEGPRHVEYETLKQQIGSMPDRELARQRGRVDQDSSSDLHFVRVEGDLINVRFRGFLARHVLRVEDDDWLIGLLVYQHDIDVNGEL